MVAPHIKRLDLCAKINQSCVFNPQGAAAMCTVLKTMAETLDNNHALVLRAQHLLAAEEQERKQRIVTQAVMEEMFAEEIEQDRRTATRAFVKALFRARKKELKRYAVLHRN